MESTALLVRVPGILHIPTYPAMLLECRFLGSGIKPAQSFGTKNSSYNLYQSICSIFFKTFFYAFIILWKRKKTTKIS